MAGTRRRNGVLTTTLLLGVVLSLLAPPTLAQADPRTPTPEQDRRSDRMARVTLEEALGEVYAGRASARRWSTYLCSGYVGCRQAGYGNRGYQAHSGTMYWLMYSGHNCTNYAAYRMVRAGMPNRRPWTGTGNAYNWGRAKSGITDDRPRVGAVAWWRANVPGAGSNGHVAYVEKVISKRRIVISEDSWSGDFHWRRIDKRDGSWPSGFIHFRDVKVRAVRKPRVTAVPEVGVPLTVDVGRWKPSPKLTLQWYADGQPIAGATSRTLTPTPDLVRKHLAVRVTARKFGYLPGAARTERTVRVERGDLQLQDGAVLVGEPRVGETLRVERPTWRPAAGAMYYRWLADGERIRGVRSSRLTLGPDLAGSTISVRTVARTDGYRKGVDVVEGRSAVERGRFDVTSPFSLGGPLLVGRTLTVTSGTFSPADGEVAYHWLRDGKVLEAVHGATYELGARDLGHTMSVQPRLRRDGYKTRILSLSAAGPVLTRPQLTASQEVTRHRLRLRLEVTAPGVRTVHGPVTLRIDGRTLERALDQGRAHWTVKHLEPGVHPVRLVYGGTDLVTARRLDTEVRVRRD